MEELTILYNAFWSATMMVYVLYNLNRDYGKLTPAKIAVALLVDTVLPTILVLNFSGLGVMFTIFASFALDVVIVSVIWGYNIFASLVSSAFSLILACMCDIGILIFYSVPFKVPREEYRTSFFHITMGSFVMILITVLVVKILSNKVIVLRNYAWNRNRKLVIILSADFIAALFWISICSNVMSFYLNYTKAFYEQAGGLLALSVLAIAILSIFFINNIIVGKLQYIDVVEHNNLDSLTGVLSRKAGLEYLKQQLILCTKNKHPLTVCYMDINNLKVVNDTYGHKQGDWLIVSVINLIKENIRNTDQISRLGGDEFLIIFPSYSRKEAELIAKRALNQLENTVFEANNNYTFSFSYGFAESDWSKRESAEQLMERADQEMYQFKQAYKENRYKNQI